VTGRSSGDVDGVLVLLKPGGMTSHDVVATMRRALGTRRVGHAGTLDPMATGVLVLGVGRATRLLGYLAGADKSYEATIRLGEARDTDDAAGHVVRVADDQSMAAVTSTRLATALGALTGDIQQVPSAVSAIKVDGRRSYQRVRDGEQVSLPARAVTVSELSVLKRRDVPATQARAAAGGSPSTGTPTAGYVDLDVRTTVSSGGYVRALARDLGQALGVGGHLRSLHRTRSGVFADTEAQPLAEAESAPSLLSLGHVARRCFEVRPVSEPEVGDLSHGRPLGATGSTEVVAALDDAGCLVALLRDGSSRRDPTVLARPRAVFVAGTSA
jgi:tRNA pseudouridine55 synthase